MIYLYCYHTEIGCITILEKNKKIIKILVNQPIQEETYIVSETPFIHETYQQLSEYFQGKRKKFTIPLNPHGTRFQKKVWKELLKIPYGTTCTYQDIAKKIGHPKAYRAVGNANHQNPIPILIPCHRVVGKNNKLTGYTLGLPIKEYLLQLEKETDLTS